MCAEIIYEQGPEGRDDKVIVTTIQKLGLALDTAGPRNFRERLKPVGTGCLRTKAHFKKTHVPTH